MSDRFLRKPLTCSKCGSLWMEERQVREMFVSPYKDGVPLYSGGTKTRIYCGECGALCWRDATDKAPEKKVKEKTA